MASAVRWPGSGWQILLHGLCVGSLVFCTGATPGHATWAQEPNPDSPRFSIAYLAAVREYQAGRFGRAMSALLETDHADIELTIAWLKERYLSFVLTSDVEREINAPANSWTTADVKAAAIAHLDLAVSYLSGFHALLNRHLDDAARLLDLERHGPRKGAPHFVLPAEVRRDSYVAMVWQGQFLGDFGGLSGLLDRIERQFPRDPDLRLAAGTLAEEFAWEMRIRRDSAPSRLLPRLRRLSEMARNEVFEEAEVHFRRALAVQPGFGEATLRLGRVLAGRGRHTEAIDVLAPLLQSTDDPWHGYLARLFAGSSCESLSRFDEAIAHYTIAAAMQPRAQTARVALSHALREAGELPSAAAAAREALAIHPDRDYDPWLEYHNGQSRLLSALMARLRKEVVG